MQEVRSAVRFDGAARPGPSWLVDSEPMPGINPQRLNSVVYLYDSEEELSHGSDQGACGFLVGVRFPGQSPLRHLYLVTAAHAVRNRTTGQFKREQWARLSGRNGGSHQAVVRAADWHTLANEAADLAIAPLQSGNVDHLRWIESGVFLTPGDPYVGPGSDVYMLSRFLLNDGGKLNAPAVRFGTIAMMPGAPVPIASLGYSMSCFTLEMRSIGGHSGSPVMVSRIPWMAVRTSPGDWVDHAYLLGVDCGHFRTRVQAEFLNGQVAEIRENSGMSFAVPAWKIKELLNEDPLRLAREEIEARHNQTLGATALD